MDTAAREYTARRVIAAFAIAALYALACYLLIDWLRPDTGLVSVTFLFIQPAVICSFICYVADPLGRRRLRFYLMVPLVMMAGMIVLAVLIVKEGAVCIVMLTPLWLLSGGAGAWAVHALRRRKGVHGYDETFLSPALLAVPFVMMPLEAAVTPPQSHFSVIRETIIHAPAAEIWPLMQGIPDVQPGEGIWNVTQDIIGVPRPLSARLIGHGPGAVRLARWDHGVQFSEVISQWQPMRHIAWQFDFSGSQGWEFTDRHLRPDSAYMQIEDGGYSLIPLADGRQLLRLETRYKAQTQFNAYAALWGELFLGDLESNMLAVIKHRAEKPR